MAYTIISQNNTTTTLADENGNVITVPARVTLATSTDYTITKVNNNSVDLVDGNGKVIRGVPACVVLAGEGGGGGGGSSYTAGTGISIDANNEISVTDPVLVNKATGTKSLVILSSTQSYTYTYLTVCGSDAFASGNNATVVGYNSCGSTDAVAVGYQADTKQGGVSIGKWAGDHTNCGARSVYIGQLATGSSSATDGIAIGYRVQAKAQHAIQLGSVSSSAATTNSDANTFKVANANGNFELMNANGNLPADRLASTSGLADGNYRLRLTMASGVPTLEWVAE